MRPEYAFFLFVTMVNILVTITLTVSELRIQTGVMKKRRPRGN